MKKPPISYFPTRWFVNNISSSTMCFSDMKVISNPLHIYEKNTWKPYEKPFCASHLASSTSHTLHPFHPVPCSPHPALFSCTHKNPHENLTLESLAHFTSLHHELLAPYIIIPSTLPPHPVFCPCTHKNPPENLAQNPLASLTFLHPAPLAPCSPHTCTSFNLHHTPAQAPMKYPNENLTQFISMGANLFLPFSTYMLWNLSLSMNIISGCTFIR